MVVQQYIGYDNIVTISNITADSAQTSYPITNAANPATNLKWKSDSLNVQYITITNASSKLVDYIGIAAHNLGTAACTIEVLGYRAGAWSTIISPFTVSTDRPIFKRFNQYSLSFSSTWNQTTDIYDSAEAFSSIRLKLTPISIKPFIGVIYVGEIMQLERGCYVGHTPITYGRDVTEVNGLSESGDFLGRVIKQTAYNSAIKLSNLTPVWYRQVFEPFVIACKTKPFFYAWRMNDYADEVGYCWINGGVPIPENTGNPAHMAVSFRIGGQA